MKVAHGVVIAATRLWFADGTSTGATELRGRGHVGR
jgi:hypothetical protein